jgi:hypothetical protein
MTDFDDKRRSVNPQRKKSEAPKIYFKGISMSTTGTGESSQSGAGTIPRSSANPSSETTSGESTMSPSSIQVRKSPAEIMKSGPGPMMSRRSNRTSFPMVPKRRTKSTGIMQIHLRQFYFRHIIESNKTFLCFSFRTSAIDEAEKSPASAIWWLRGS